jgi:hypothetical protein
MAALEGAINMMGRLTVADNNSPQGTRQDETKLRDKCLKLVRVAKQIVDYSEPLMRYLDTDELLFENLTILDTLGRDTRILSNTVVSMNDTTQILVAAHISSLGEQSPEVRKLLSYFRPQLKTIIGGVLSTTRDGEPKLLSILEECYKHSLDDGYGALCCDGYFNTLKEAALGSPYDPDYQSAEYYEYENRMQVDQNYARAQRKRSEKMHSEERAREQKTKGAWIGFWLHALQECPGGPTLFVPTETLRSDGVPLTSRYLFRAFDSASSGLSNDTVVASTASMYSDLEVSQLNLLSIDKREATLRMLEHLEKPLFGGSNSDNLMSWSNSLLFVLQYAIWRSEQRRWYPNEVQICAIDTSRFPKGQFARDMWLINKCHDASWSQDPLESLVGLRRRRGYYNGEHLSQGTVNHKGRSCVVSLQDLIDAGLCELCPELDDLEGRKGWTNRVLSLRSMWSTTSSTTQEDIRLAMQLAKSCFYGMATLDIALMFLTFKDRKVLRDTEVKTSKFGSNSSLLLTGRLTTLYRDSVPAAQLRCP